MFYQRTNKAGNMTEVIRLSDVSFVRGKFTPSKGDVHYQVQVFLQSGSNINMSTSKEDFENLVESLILLKKEVVFASPVELNVPDIPKRVIEVLEQSQTSLDDLIDDLETKSEGGESEEDNKEED